MHIISVDSLLASSWLHTKMGLDYTGSTAGEAEGYYNIHPTSSEKKNSDYMDGWNQGQSIRLPANVGFDKDFYLDYYVGDYNGAVAADKDDNAGGDDGTSNHCGSGHSQEYCIGHKAGYLVEAYLLNDA
ncbi:MAG: hypothetical protein WBZ36_08235 [Candidatus Nitrosopolaris sp.]